MMKIIELHPDEEVKIRLVGGGVGEAIANRDARIEALEEAIAMCCMTMWTEANTVEFNFNYPRGVGNLRKKAKIAEKILGKEIIVDTEL